jgi:hypothetical protein
MGSNSASNGNSGSDAFVNKKSKVKTVKRDKFGYEVKQNPVVKFVKGGVKAGTDYVKSGGAVGGILRDLKKFTKPSARQIEDRKLPFGERNQFYKIDMFNKRNKGQRDFYTNRVLKGTEKANFGSLNSNEQEKQFKSYLAKRISGETDAIGRTRVQGKGGDGVPNSSGGPTVGKVDQATTNTEPTEGVIEKTDDIILRKKKTKAQGRSMTILKSAQGATDQGLTLGKRSLLGS